MARLLKRDPNRPPPPLRPREEAVLRALRTLNDTPHAGSKRYGGAELHEIAEHMGLPHKAGHQNIWSVVSGLIARNLAERVHGFDGIGDLLITEDGRCLLSEIESERRFRD